jgi:hypothetical protein
LDEFGGMLITLMYETCLCVVILLYQCIGEKVSKLPVIGRTDVVMVVLTDVVKDVYVLTRT